MRQFSCRRITETRHSCTRLLFAKEFDPTEFEEPENIHGFAYLVYFVIKNRFPFSVQICEYAVGRRNKLLMLQTISGSV